MPRSQQRQSWERKGRSPKTDPGQEDPGSLHRDTDWRDLSGITAGPRKSSPRQNTAMGFACACPGRAIPGWKRRRFGRFPLPPVPVGIQGWGSTHRSSTTQDGTFQAPNPWTTESRQYSNSKFPENSREWATTKLQTGEELRVEKHRVPNWGRTAGRQTLRSEFGENREWATNGTLTGRKLEADKL